MAHFAQLERSLPAMLSRALIDPKSIDVEKREFEVVVSTGALGLMRGFVEGEGWITFEEELEISESAIDLSRIRGGVCPLIDSHGRLDTRAEGYQPSLQDQIGRVLEAYVVGKQLRARVRFSHRAEHAGLWADIVAGVITACSPKYEVTKYRKLAQPANAKVPRYRAIKWTIFEVSMVPIPMDAGARVRHYNSTTAAEIDMDEIDPVTGQPIQPASATATAPAAPTPAATTTQVRAAAAPAAPVARSAEPPAQPAGDDTAALVRAGILREQQRITAIRTHARALNLTTTEDATLVDRLIADEVPAEQAAVQLLLARSQRDQATIGSAPSGAIFVGADPRRVGAREGMVNALMVRSRARAHADGQATGNPLQYTDQGRLYATYSLMRMAEECVAMQGANVRNLSPHDLLSRAFMSTSDFPNILADVFNKRLRDGYGQAPATWMDFAKRADLADFKRRSVVNLGEAPVLEKVRETGEFKTGKIDEAAESYGLETFGKIVTLTRQAIINDDTRAFDQIAARFGRQAIELESNIVWGLITGNVTLADGQQLFSAPHANTGGGAIDVAGIGTAIKTMRLQKGLDGVTPLNLMPAYLIVPAALEAVAKQYQTQLTPAQGSQVNPWVGTFRKVIVEPRLDASSVVQWYVVCDPSLCDAIEYAYLRGQDGLYMESEWGFEVDGMRFKARHDFGAAAIDHRAFYRSTGS